MAEVDKKGEKYYILLLGKCAVKRDKGITRLSKDKFVTLLKGDILIEACEREQPKEKTLIRLNPIEKLTVSLECPVTDVQRIDEDEANLLLGLSSLRERLRVSQERDTLRIAKEMVVGSHVWVTVAVHGVKLPGVIKYKGPLRGSPGTMFGVQLLASVDKGSTDGSFKGQHYFHCEKDAGMFVSLEKLKPRNVESSLSSSTLSKQLSEEFLDGDIEHKIEDAVLVFIGEKPHRGIVKYIGRPPGEKRMIAGIQMDTNCGKGDGEYYGKQLFTCLKKYAHFTPIENVISKETFRQMYDDPKDVQVSTPEASKQNNESSPRSDSLERELDVGSVVEILSKYSSPKYGVIRWIGFVPSVSPKVAGLELEEKLDLCNDGTFQGTRYFTCSSQRAFFVHLRNCKPDSRFGKSGNSLPSTDRRLTGTGNSIYSCSKKALPALAAAPVAQIESFLTCSICLETLQDPRTLGCFHSFCKSCLEKFVKRQREMARAEAAAKGKDVNLEEFNCPVCRFSFCLKQGQEVEGMARNHFVGNMLEVLAIQRQTKGIPCSLCEGPSVSHCTTCNRFLCATCLSAHENWLEFKDHVVLTMDELASPENQGKTRGRSYCKKHEKKSLKFYCETCQELVCRYCMDFNHAKENHSCLLAEDVAEKEREAIKLCCGILEENLKEGNQALQEISNVAQSLENNAKKAKQDIIQQKETIIKTFTQKLEEEAHLMMNEVDEKCKEILIPIEKQKSEIQAYVEKMKGSVDLSKNLLDKGNNEEILSSKKMIEENVGRMKKECPKGMKPVHDGVIQFKVKPINYAVVIDNLGEIACTGIAPDSNLLNTSTILKDEPGYIGQMDEWMNNQFQWRLCYRASTDGWHGKDFHRCCDNKGPTVTVVKVGGYIFGGYTDQTWEGTGYRESTSSFLFSLRNKDNVPPFKAPVYQLSGYAIRCTPSSGPIFGNGRDLKIVSNPQTNRNSFTRFGATYKPPAGYSYDTEQTNSLLAGSLTFSPTEIEVFY